MNAVHILLHAVKTAMHYASKICHSAYKALIYVCAEKKQIHAPYPISNFYFMRSHMLKNN